MERLIDYKWIRPALIGAAVLVSAFLGYMADLTMLAMALGAVAGLAGVLVLIKTPPLGLVLLIGAAVLVPFGIGTGSQTMINAAMLVLAGLIGLWVFRRIVERQEFRLISSSPIPPLLLLVGSAFLSLLIGQADWFPTQHAPLRAQIGGVMLFVFSAGAFLLAAHEIKEIEWLERMTWAFLVLGSVYLVVSIVPGLQARLFLIFNPRAYGSVYWIWMICIAYSQFIYNKNLNMYIRGALVALLAGAIFISMILNNEWTSGWLPAFAGVLAMMIVSRSRLLYAAIALGLLVVIIKIDSIFAMLMVGDNAYSLNTRLAALGVLSRILEVNPIFGLGPANYYWYTPMFGIMGYYVPFNSHNNYVDIVAQTGLLGLFLFLLFAWKTGWLGMNLRSRVPEGFPIAYVYGALGGLAGMLVAAALGDWVIPFVYNVGFTGFRASLLGWLFLGGLVALEQIYQNRSDL